MPEASCTTASKKRRPPLVVTLSAAMISPLKTWVAPGASRAMGTRVRRSS